MKMKTAEIIAICILTTVVIIGCGDKPETAKKKSNDNLITRRYARVDKEMVALLSVKYSVDEKVVETLIHEYKNEHSYLRGLRKSIRDNVVMKTNDDYKSTIISLSVKYSLPKEKIASIFLDYKMYGMATDVLDQLSE